MACNLSPPELYKYDWRVEAFIENLRAGTPFRLLDGTDVVIDYTDELLQRIQQGEQDRDVVRGAFLRLATAPSV